MIDKSKLKKELFTKYNIALSDDDPLWLLMLMQKDMTEEVLSATKVASSNNKNFIATINKEVLNTTKTVVEQNVNFIANINRKALIAIGVSSFVFGILLVGGVAYYQVRTAKDELATVNKELANKELQVKHLGQQNETRDAVIVSIRDKVLPNDYYYNGNDGKSKYIGVKSTDSRFSKDSSKGDYTIYYIKLK